MMNVHLGIHQHIRNSYLERGKCFTSPALFYFVLLFLTVVFIAIYGLLCFTTTNQKLKVMLLIKGLLHHENAIMKKTKEVIKEELIYSLRKSEDEDLLESSEFVENLKEP